ncbi:MAG: hypothetical protein HY725_00740 [Candidatus Rokubacteria bacterium]|nr:hypothetical protein [Candidatus Rokubacteria bacterium]
MMKVIGEWAFVVVLFVLSSALFFCSAAAGILQPDLCARLAAYVMAAAKAVMRFLGGAG